MKGGIQPSEWSVEVLLGSSAAPVICVDHPDGWFRLDERPERASPVDHLLVAIAWCLGKSLHIVMGARRIRTVPVRIRAHARKADDPPGRVDKIDVAVRIADPSPSPGMGRLLLDAKRICTVTNTLDAKLVTIVLDPH